MELKLNDQEQQVLKSVLHALYHSYDKETCTCRACGVTREDLKVLIDIHDTIVGEELKQSQPDDTDPEMAEALDYVRSQLDEWRLEEYRAAINSAYEYHTTPTAYADFDHIRDLLEEYGRENDLGEDWWESKGDLDDWLYEL